MSQSPTNKKFKKPSPKFDASAFARDILKGESGVASALERLRIAIYSGSDVLSELLSDEHKHLFEYTFSILDDDGVTYLLRKELLSRLHIDDGSLMPSGFPILERLSKFIYDLPNPPDDVKPTSLLEKCCFISASQEAMCALEAAGFIRQTSPAAITQPEGDGTFGEKTRRPSSPKQMKHAKRSRADTIEIDDRPFKKLGEAVPSTKDEAQMLALKLFQRQKEDFANFLRTPAFSSAIRDLYVPTNFVQQPDETPGTQETEAHVPPVEAEVHDEVPSYPHIQPIKASLYFDNADGFGEWAIIISDSACKHLRGYAREPSRYRAILAKLKELSNGIFSEDNQRRLKGPDKGIPVFEVKFSGRLTGDLRLVYQVDVLSESVDRESQVIRVFGIFTHAQMDDRMWASLSAQLTVRGPEYRRRINCRKYGPTGILPQSWPGVSEDEETPVGVNSKSLVTQAYQEQLHKWLVLEKYTALSQALLDCILADKDSSTIFIVSPREREIIEHPSSCYVLGRGGTGKTTTMAFKIFGIERTTKTNMHSDTRPRQLFVTQSPKLAKKVREYYTNLSGFLSAATGTPLSGSFEEVQTKDKLYDEEDEDGFSDLPKRFSELEESHFPLFLSYDKLCRLLEADMGLSFTHPSSRKKRRQEESRNSISSLDWNDYADAAGDDALNVPRNEAEYKSRVSFQSFCSDYWPHFRQDLTRHLDPALVFSELIGVIKGSEQTLKSTNRCLSRDEYLGLSERTRPLSTTLRENIYSLFEKYMILKREYGDHDLADRCHAIFQCMKRGHKFSVDFLYVDETQDNLIIDAFVLRMLCQNPHGLFWAGDTAQTIAIGSSFRLDDLKSALYSFERELYPCLNKNILVQPSFFQLITNYRSHKGIVNCAGLIIELIVHFWPNSIDTLTKERGLVDGPKPIFFTGRNDGTALYKQFLKGNDGKYIELGARQCILVRDAQAKSKLKEQAGKKIGMILTLYESKGLEFDDVLLYDFFADSQYDLSSWRVVLNFLPKRDESKIIVPRFNEIRHAGICTELKFLYVAVTRARKNLWIIDQSADGEPVKRLLSHLGGIVILTPDEAPKLAEPSSPQEWEKEGRELFKKQVFDEAKVCFERAGLHDEGEIAEAYDLRKQARNVPRCSDYLRVEAFSKAGRAFFSCAQRSKDSGSHYYRNAAACFEESRAYNHVARAYEEAGEYLNAAGYYVKATQFEKAVKIVKENRIEPDAEMRVIRAAALHYTRMKRFDDALDVFDHSQEAYLAFLEDVGLHLAKAMFLEKIGRFHEAAEAYFHSGNEERSIRLFMKDSKNPDSIQYAAKYALRSLWKQMPFGLDKRCDHEIANHLEVLQGKHRAKLSASITEQLDMFDAINQRDRVALLKTYGLLFWTRNNSEPETTVLILDHLFTKDYAINDTQEAIQYVQASFAYATILKDLWNRSDLMDHTQTQWLFGFRRSSEHQDDFIISENGFLATYLTKSSSVHRNRVGLILDLHELTRIVKMAVQSRLADVLHIQVNICARARKRLFDDPCSAHAKDGRCNQYDYPRQDVDFKPADSETRIRFHLFQIRFLHAADFASHKSRDILRNTWLSNLLTTLNTSVPAFGGWACIATNWRHEFEPGMDIVGLWMEERAYQLDGVSSGKFLNTATDIAECLLWIHRSLSLAQSVIPDLVACLGMLEPDFVASGCRFVQCVIKEKLHISIDHLCQIVELLCASCIILFANDSGSFHNCLLPKAWLFHVALRIDLDRSYNIRRPSWMLIEQCDRLASYLLLESATDLRHIWGTSTSVKDMSIYRILRAVVLVGYNTTSARRDSIIRLVGGLRANCRTDMHPLVKLFLMSQNWSDLRRAVEGSHFRSSLDKMIQLVQHGKPARTTLGNSPICTLRFKDKRHLLSLISPASAEHAPQPSPRAEPLVSESKMTSGITEVREHIDPSETITDDPGIDKEGQSIEDEDAREKDTLQPDGKEMLAEFSAGLVQDEPVDRQDTAARVIQQFFKARRRERAARTLQRRYRLILRRRAEMDLPGVRGRRATYYGQCVASDVNKNGTWTSIQHRFIFLGLIPDLLACLDALRDQNQKNKDGERRRLRPSSKLKGVDYDEVNMRITCAKYTSLKN